MTGTGAAAVAAAVACRHCRKPIVRCDSQPGHGGCSSGHGWIHLEPHWGHHCPNVRPYRRQYAQPETGGDL